MECMAITSRCSINSSRLSPEVLVPIEHSKGLVASSDVARLLGSLGDFNIEPCILDGLLEPLGFHTRHERGRRKVDNTHHWATAAIFFGISGRVAKLPSPLGWGAGEVSDAHQALALRIEVQGEVDAFPKPAYVQFIRSFLSPQSLPLSPFPSVDGPRLQ